MGNTYQEAILDNRRYREGIAQEFHDEQFELENNRSNRFLGNGGVDVQGANGGLFPKLLKNAFNDPEKDIDDQNINPKGISIEEYRGKLMVLGAFIMILLKIWFA
jgi:hypothetical protein